MFGHEKMNINEELWQEHYQVLVSFVHHLAYYRTLKASYAALHQKSEFWKWTIDAHLLRAVIDWCMVFGTDDNAIHWKKVAVDQQAQDSFRDRLLKVTRLTRTQWGSYWHDMIKFRNDYAAHRVVAQIYPTTPKMDTALLVVTTYDEWIREALGTAFAEPTLQERYDRLSRVSKKSSMKQIQIGPNLDEEYEGIVPSE